MTTIAMSTSPDPTPLAADTLGSEVWKSERIRSAPGRLATLVLLLTATLLLIPSTRPLFGLGGAPRLLLGLAAVAGFAWLLRREAPARRRVYLVLAAALALLAISPIDTGLGWGHMALLGTIFLAVLVGPWLALRGEGLVVYRWFPRHLDRLDLLYTLLSVPLAWGAFALYFGVLSPEAPFNWQLPATPDDLETFKLFLGINAVGVWDELFFINTCYALLRALFGPRVAVPAQAVIYVSVLWGMAFTGWGPLLVLLLALTQGMMMERSRVLIWVLIVHLVVDYFLFQGIVTAHYPDLTVWWHP
jgi:hypothetical protein